MKCNFLYIAQMATRFHHVLTQENLTARDAQIRQLDVQLRLSMPVAATDPTNVKQGALYYNSVDDTVRAYDGTTWNVVGGGVSTSIVDTDGDTSVQTEFGGADSDTVGIVAAGVTTATFDTSFVRLERRVGVSPLGIYDGGDGGTGTQIAAFFGIDPPDALVLGGAISTSNYFTTIDTSIDPTPYTLADGAMNGQVKTIQLLNAGGGLATITVDTFSNGTAITMINAGDEVQLMWYDVEGWVLLRADGATTIVP